MKEHPVGDRYGQGASSTCNVHAAHKVRRLRERDIERYLVSRARAAGGEVRKVQWVGRRGAPDRLLLLPRREALGLPGEGIWVELKAPGKKPEPHQLREHERMRKLGQRVEVVDSMAGVDRFFA